MWMHGWFNHVLFLFHKVIILYLQEIWSVAPEIVNQSSAHDHVHGHHHGGHHHGIDMEHPVLALNMTIVSIAVKEGSASHVTVNFMWYC